MHEKPLNMACHVVRTPSVELLLLPGLVAGCSYGWGGQQSQLQLKPVVSLSSSSCGCGWGGGSGFFSAAFLWVSITEGCRGHCWV